MFAFLPDFIFVQELFGLFNNFVFKQRDFNGIVTPVFYIKHVFFIYWMDFTILVDDRVSIDIDWIETFLFELFFFDSWKFLLTLDDSVRFNIDFAWVYFDYFAEQNSGVKFGYAFYDWLNMFEFDLTKPVIFRLIWLTEW